MTVVDLDALVFYLTLTGVVGVATSTMSPRPSDVWSFTSTQPQCHSW
jgi:hypothetical protein